MADFFDLGLLRWLEGLRNPVLDAVMQFFTFFGEELLFMVVALVFLWCIDKWKGYYLLSVGFVGTILSQFLKLWFRIPRPWVKDPNFTIVESARADAGGYSFPSGHTQSAVGTYGGIARFAKQRWLRIVAIVLAALVCLSRLYLGVHTLADVSVAAVLAILLVLVLYPIFSGMEKHPNRMYGLIVAFLVMALGYLLFVKLYHFPAEAYNENYYEGLKNAYSLSGALLGLLIAYPMEQRFIRYDTHAPLPGQILKVALGLLGALAIKEGLKPLLNLFWEGYWFPNAIRYCVLVIFAGAIWPLTFKYFAKIGKSR